MHWPQVELALIINAYDDGLSTGALRDFVPGMLGPSDFRKNLSYILDLHSTEQYALRSLLECRLSHENAAPEVKVLKTLSEGVLPDARQGRLAAICQQLEPLVRQYLATYLAYFFNYAKGRPGLKFEDCAVGNLVFAGAHILHGNNFNQAALELAGLTVPRAKLVNVSRGEPRTLAALKADGTLLSREADICGPQSPAPIVATYFTERPITRQEMEGLVDVDLAAKKQSIESRQSAVEPSEEALQVLRDADLVIFGPGTQHSSLLPSYKILSASQAIARSPARIKAFIVNLNLDHDIQGLTANDLVRSALAYMGDPANRGPSITHVLFDQGDDARSVPLDRSGLGSYGTLYSAALVEGRFSLDPRRQMHSGYAVVSRLFYLLERSASTRGIGLSVHVDLLRRSAAVGAVVQELSEIDWGTCVDRVELKINHANLPNAHLPSCLKISSIQQSSTFAEVEALKDWLAHDDSEYLATITGDGEYLLRDLQLGLMTLRNGNFCAVYGSRTQSRRQFRGSLQAAYSESNLLYGLSWLGAFLLTAVFVVRFGIIFSDPLTGFRIYKRSRLPRSLAERLSTRRLATATTITKAIIRESLDIAEIPVTYRTFVGFTEPSWRFKRGILNLLGAVR
jgi:2-phospho-L-lactate transferase/gluconeogenesis factor (CofD/UPF0052 family)